MKARTQHWHARALVYKHGSTNAGRWSQKYAEATRHRCHLNFLDNLYRIVSLMVSTSWQHHGPTLFMERCLSELQMMFGQHAQ